MLWALLLAMQSVYAGSLHWPFTLPIGSAGGPPIAQQIAPDTLRVGCCILIQSHGAMSGEIDLATIDGYAPNIDVRSAAACAPFSRKNAADWWAAIDAEMSITANNGQGWGRAFCGSPCAWEAHAGYACETWHVNGGIFSR